MRVLTLNRPEKANAVTAGMLSDLADAVEAANADPSVNAIIFTGRGRVFSAGADLDAMQAGLGDDPVWERLSGAVAQSPALTIAALNGTAAGGALGMVFACDLRVAVPRAKLFYPVMKLGFLPQPSDPARISAVVGPARAKLLLMGGQKLTTDQAHAMGFFDQIAEDVMGAARTLAVDALQAERAHVAAIKGLFARER